MSDFKPDNAWDVWLDLSKCMKARVRCLCPTRDGNGELQYCTGTVEGTPAEVLGHPDHKWVFKCPVCKAEFGRGKRLMFHGDLGKGMFEFLKHAQNAPFGIDLLFPLGGPLQGYSPTAPGAPAPDMPFGDGGCL